MASLGQRSGDEEREDECDARLEFLVTSFRRQAGALIGHEASIGQSSRVRRRVISASWPAIPISTGVVPMTGTAA